MKCECGCAQVISEEIDIAEGQAWKALGRYKFQMFGYWCALWVHLNRISGEKRPNPWRELVLLARENQTGNSGGV